MDNIKLKYCTECEYRSKWKNNLKRHILYKHTLDDEITWYPCDQLGCNRKFKTNGELKQHKLYKHNIDITWHQCNQSECYYKAKNKNDLKRHNTLNHDTNISWHYCFIDECDFKSRIKGNLKQHKMYKHNIDVTWYPCNQSGCDKKFKSNKELKQHVLHKHTSEEQINWKKCPECNKNFKTNSGLKTHKLYKHNIGIAWYYCNVEGCISKFKTNSDLKRHLSYIHDIGTKNCSFCKRNVYSLTNYQNKQGKNEICRRCYNKVTGKNSRAETQMSNYLDKNIGTEFLLGSDRSLKSMGGCQLYRPDKLYSDPNIIIHIECDEFQHKRNNTTYLCDEKRISDIYDEFSGKKYIVIRWNPDHYKPLNNKKKVNRSKRLELLITLFRNIQSNPPNNIITIYYMFYNVDNILIAKNIPYYLIQNENDLNKLFEVPN